MFNISTLSGEVSPEMLIKFAPIATKLEHIYAMIPFSGQMLQSMFEFIIIVISVELHCSIQSSVASRWASGHSPGSPLNV